jgi:hypothetical protein
VTSPLHPSEGVRVVLEIEDVGAEKTRALYRASLYTPTEVFVYRVALSEGGEAEVTPLAAKAAAGFEKKLLNIARSVARAAERKRKEGLQPWPARVMRWRI